MAIPSINATPKYSVKIPSTGKVVTYRPFLVKEQKILLMAMESQDAKQILRSITDTIESCVISPIDIDKLATFDVEYIFTQIRSTSVGEVSKVQIKCKGCAFDNAVEINLQDIKIDLDSAVSNKVVLNDQYTVLLRYPTFTEVSKRDELLADNPSITDTLMSLVVMALDKLLTDDEIIDLTSESQESLDEFINNLTTEQFQLLLNFVENVPSLSHELNFDCISCKVPNTYKLEGINDFF